MLGGEEDPLQTFLWINDLWCIEYMRQTQAYIKPSPAVIKKDTYLNYKHAGFNGVMRGKRILITFSLW